MTSNLNYDNLKSFVEKVDNAKKQNIADLSSDQDLSIAIMNLISIEEHLFFSGAKTGKSYSGTIDDASKKITLSSSTLASLTLVR